MHFDVFNSYVLVKIQIYIWGWPTFLIRIVNVEFTLDMDLDFNERFIIGNEEDRGEKKNKLDLIGLMCLGIFEQCEIPLLYVV